MHVTLGKGLLTFFLLFCFRYDRYDVFAEAVSEEEAPGYGDIVENPMDFGTMKKKIIPNRKIPKADTFFIRDYSRYIRRT